MTNPDILITAPTGLTGQGALSNLLKNGRKVRALAHREDDRSRALQAAGAEVVFGDFNDYASIKAALKGIKRAYFCYPISTGLVLATAKFAEAAKDNGVETIVNMSQRVAREDAASHASFEHWLAERVLDWTGIPVTHLRPPFFAEWLFFMAPMIKQGQVYAPFAKGKNAFITAEDQGRVIAKILENPEPHKGKTYYLYGPEELSFQEAMDRASRALGKPIAYHVVPFDVMRDNMAANNPKSGQNSALSGYAESNQTNGSGEPHIFQHLRSAHQDFENGLFDGMNNDVEKITGAPPMSIEQFVAKNRTVFM